MRKVFISLIVAAVLVVCCKNSNADVLIEENEYANIDSIQKARVEGQKLNVKAMVVRHIFDKKAAICLAKSNGFRYACGICFVENVLLARFYSVG